MARWHHWLDGRESEWTLGVGDGQGYLACCDSWGRKESDTTEPLNWTKLNVHRVLKSRMLKRFTIPFSRGSCFVRTLHYDPSVLGGPMQLIVSLSYKNLWSMLSFWEVFCDCGFLSVCPLIDEDKRLMQISWSEGLAMGKTVSCSGGQGLLSKTLIQFSDDRWGCVPGSLS